LATVITNLFSAIPWIGPDLVESNNIIQPALIGPVSDQTPMGAMVELPLIGSINKYGRKKFRLDDKYDYLTIPYTFLAFLVGLIDGDGYIGIHKTEKGFITMRLVIAIHLNDLATLEYIKSVLKLGEITVYPDLKSPTCKLIINKTDLQEIFFPKLIKHNIFFLTSNRRDQFNLAMLILQRNLKLFKDIERKPYGSSESNSLTPLEFNPSTPTEYINLPFFKNWFVGFTNAEGSFFINDNNDGFYQIKQINNQQHLILFNSFNLLLDTTKNI
jgi:hypothetical protein